MSSKRESELEIFKLFYNNRTDISFEHKDLPDFWVESPFRVKFGLEITELFDNESEARLNKIPNYMDDLFQGGDFKHKDDKHNLNVTEISILSPDNKHIATVPALKYDNIVPEAFIGLLTDRIGEKSRLLSNYTTTLSFHSLVIRDHSHILLNVERKDMYWMIYKPQLTEILKESGFAEIYLVRRYKDGYYSLPLKGFLLLSRIYYFNEVLNTLGLVCEDDFEFHNCFAEMLTHEKFCAVKVRRIKNEIEVVYGNFGISAKNQKSITIKDYREYQPPPNELTEPIKSEFLSAETIAVFAELDKTFGIEGEFYFKLSGIEG